MVKGSLSECLSLLNEHMSIQIRILNDYRHIDYHIKQLNMLYKQTTYSTKKVLCELIGLTERIVDRLEKEEFKKGTE